MAEPMTQEQKFKILCLYAYRWGEICEANGIKSSNESNWKHAVNALDSEVKVNGDKYALSMMEKNERGTL